jgi:eukaryotic-like serine/threonine-protein kinase
MKCSACGMQLPAGVAYCPNCGTPTPVLYAPTGTTPNNPTVSSSAQNTPPPSPYTNYGSQQYGAQSPNDAPPPPPNLYNTPQSSAYYPGKEQQFVPPSKPRSNRIGLIIGIAALVLVIIVGGILAISRLGTQQGSSTNATATTAATQSPQEHATATAQAQASATAAVNAANPNPYTPGLGTLALIDPLTDNSKGYAWDASVHTNGTCAFIGGSYHVSTPKTQFFYLCSAEASDFSNYAFEVQLKVVQGDCGGMVFRSDSNTGKLYFFEVCQNGSYSFSRYLDFTGNNVKDLAGGSSAAITTGLNQVNTIAVVAQGSTLTVYVNKQKLSSVTDSSFTHGQIGLFADANNNPTDVAFNNAKVWKY